MLHMFLEIDCKHGVTGVTQPGKIAKYTAATAAKLSIYLVKGKANMVSLY